MIFGVILLAQMKFWTKIFEYGRKSNKAYNTIFKKKKKFNELDIFDKINF